MPHAHPLWMGTWSVPFQGQESAWLQALGQMLDAGLEVIVVLLSFTLAIFILLVFAVRVLMIVRKLPVPIEPTDMAKPRPFRALMLGAAALLSPLMATSFLPVEGIDPQANLVVAYGFELFLAVALWFGLELLYKVR